MTPAQQQWHWQEGNKYALECMKALLLLNGGGALALLTFFGNRGKMLTTASADTIGYALIPFKRFPCAGLYRRSNYGAALSP